VDVEAAVQTINDDAAFLTLRALRNLYDSWRRLRDDRYLTA